MINYNVFDADHYNPIPSWGVNQFYPRIIKNAIRNKTIFIVIYILDLSCN